MSAATSSGVFLVTAEGTWRIREDKSAADVVCLLTELYADKLDSPLQALSRQQVATRLGRGIPADFPAEDIVTGDPHQAGTRGWWESSLQRYLSAQHETAGDEGVAVGTDTGQTQQDGSEAALAAAPDAEADGVWPLKSRRWDDVELSGVDQRVLLVTDHALLTPSGVVKAGPLKTPARLGEVVCNRSWSTPPGGANPQLWVFPEALEAVGFQIDGHSDSDLPDAVAAFFGCTVVYHKSGWFTCEFDESVYGGQTRRADIVLIPYLHLDPSQSRPADRGLAGIQGTETELPDDQEQAAHILGDRIAWLYSMEGALPAPRWTQVGAQIAEAKRRAAKPKAKNSKTTPALVPCPLPVEIASTGKLTNQWWGPEGLDVQPDTDGERTGRRGAARVKKAPHRARGNTVDVEMDQTAAYLPSAENAHLGYGKPEWVTPDKSMFNETQPAFGVFQVTTPPAEKLSGLHRKLPLPHPAMRWDKSTTWWATTTDVRQLIATPEMGGAGISWVELQIEAAWVWPEQHQWLKGFGQALRSRRIEAVSADRFFNDTATTEIYTSFLGRLEAVGEGSWKYPLLHFQQPAWYASIEAATRVRAMKYAVRIAVDHGIYPIGWWADAWFYRVPADFDLSLLEDPLRDGVRTNGSYVIKNVVRPAA